ncbi:PRC-barrel domain containing protein [Planomonospora algeriensis]
MMNENLWNYRPDVYGGDRSLDLIGFEVQGPDGEIGPVEEESTMAGDSYIVIDTGSWISDRSTLLPAGLITRVDPIERTVHVSPTREEIMDAPHAHGAEAGASRSRERLSAYYAHLLVDRTPAG